MRHDNFIPAPRFVRIRSRGRLPHWEVDDAVYFVTFRLKDSLPRHLVRELVAARARLLEEVKVDRIRFDRLFGEALDAHLDEGHGSCLLAQHASIVAGALRHFDRARYELHAWCVMPNHVHVAVHLLKGADLPRVVQCWKSFTSHRIGLGQIWQREYFDRTIRTPAEYAEVVRYIRANPAKARLSDWPWVG